MAGETDAVIRVSGLTCRYGRRLVWDGVSFEISRGDVAFLVGENGSGKSTLLRCLAGWSSPAAGDIFLDDAPFDPSDRKQRAAIAFAGDTPSFYDDLTAREHLQFVAGIGGDAVDEGLMRQLVEMFGLSGRLDQVPSSYSRGMRQKLALVIALASRARLLLLDEPQGPLDAQASQMLPACLKDAARRGAAVIMSCHHGMPDLAPDVVLRLGLGKLSAERLR